MVLGFETKQTSQASKKAEMFFQPLKPQKLENRL